MTAVTCPRICSGCGQGMREGYLCCDEYYCSRDCLDRSFEGSGTTWEEHFTEEGDCYYTEWDEYEYDPDDCDHPESICANCAFRDCIDMQRLCIDCGAEFVRKEQLR